MKKVISLTLCIVVLFLTKAYAADYYVDPANGSMANPGTQAQPWKTLKEVMASSVSFLPGDVIYLMSGRHDSVVIKNKKNTNYVFIKKFPGQTPVLSFLHIGACAYWDISGLNISPPTTQMPQVHTTTHPVSTKTANYLVRISKENFNATGSETSHHIILSNCNIYTNGDINNWTDTDWNTLTWCGIELSQLSKDNQILNCRLYNLEQGIYLWAGADNNTIKNCTIENLCCDGLWPNVNGLLFEGNTIRNLFKTSGNHYDMIQSTVSNPSNPRRDIIIRGNFLINATPSRPDNILFDPGASVQAIGLFDGPYINWQIENNVIITNNFHGISVFNMVDSRIVNNTIVMNPQIPISSNTSATRNPPGIGLENKSGITQTLNNVIVKNNIANYFYTKSSAIAVLPSDYTQENNYFVSNETFPYNTIFADYNNYNLKLRTGASDVIGAGSATDVPSFDILQTPRSSPYDIGAYEYESTALPVVFDKIGGWIIGDNFTAKWTTLNEVNVSHFNIEISKDGRNFTKAGTILTKADGGNASYAIDYDFNCSKSNTPHFLFYPFILLATALAFRKRRITFLTISIVACCFMIACNKPLSESIDKNEKTLMRILQVDNDGGKQYSKVVNVFYEK